MAQKIDWFRNRAIFLALIILLALPCLSADKQLVFQTVKKTIERDYYDESLGGIPWAALTKQTESAVTAAPDESGVYAAINRLLSELRDGHTGVSSPSSVRARKSPTQLALGFDARFLEGKLVVTAVRSGSAVETFGTQRGWLVRSVQGQTVPQTEQDFGPWIRQLGVGELCSAGKVSIDFEDNSGQTRNFTGDCTIREKERRRVARRQDRTLILAFDVFDTDAAQWFDRNLNENMDAELLILDLRENVGGAKSALLSIASRLWSSPQRLGFSISRRGRKEEWIATSSKPFPGRIVVLVDRNTRSAAEILSAALQESGRAKVLGRKTAGSVLVMVSRPLPDGGELRLSIQDFVTAKGRRLEEQGVTPNIVLPLGLEQLRSPEDQDLIRALAFPSEGE